jgi:hypothetical protein
MLSAACSWILGLKERVNVICCMPMDPRSEGESYCCLLHAARSFKRSTGESAWGLLHAARSFMRSTVKDRVHGICCMSIDPIQEVRRRE